MRWRRRDASIARLAVGMIAVAAAAVPADSRQAPPLYDLLIRGGHVIDARHGVDGVRDVAIAGGVVAAVAPTIDRPATVTIDATGVYVTPGLVDLHAHVYAGTGERGSYAGDNSVYPDGFTFRSGVTTVVDAGSSGWRNFDDFHDRVISRSRTRVLAFLNIVGHGMRGNAYEHELADMQAAPAADTARRHRGAVVGIKTAHYRGPEWTAVERAVEAGRLADVPVMVDFGRDHPERPIEELLLGKLRPGDIYTHVYSGLRREIADGRPNQALAKARNRGVYFDVGHGAGSFRWRVAVPLVRAGLLPDSISTDLHVASMNAGMKSMPEVMSKFLALDVPIAQVIAQASWHPARQIHQDQLGHLGAGAPADVALLKVEEGRFGFVDVDGTRLDGTRRVVCELTIKAGVVVYDLNGRAAKPWREETQR